ncbi:hypothetical protein [Bradyrhizobium sp. CCBAU 53421]|uniref:hypothetical protein n=1 Tax=Bradyrhizobium sp. CCBAU 53421 TaxID=1325120 RepID=UPI00188DA433|nr:hypothetical protein [Bradyrhizobium sp. CCBAU 53421]QOZ32898.1 hypothetical protein XH92_15470 [Bradyrhizobium sp. CCBAU 53421]
MARVSTHLLSVGILIVMLAVIWWWVTYRDVILYAYLSTKEAGLCLLGRSDICDLARTLCRGTPALINYWWGTFWIGVALVSASLAIHGPRRA